MTERSLARQLIRAVTSQEQRTAAWRTSMRLQHLWYGLFGSRSLVRLATAYGSDKWGRHFYAQHYEGHFAPLRRHPMNVLEIGIGGYESPTQGGASLRMWRSYFRNAIVHGLDIHDKSAHAEPRIRIHRGDQGDAEYLRRLAREIGPLQIVIDDGSHRVEHMRTSFLTLFPLLADGGFYAIEDLQTAYWEEFGGSHESRNAPENPMGMLKGLLDGLNHEEFRVPGYAPSDFDRTVVAVHCYHNLAIIEKGRNDEAGRDARESGR